MEEQNKGSHGAQGVEAQEDYRLVLVGNIIDRHYYGMEKEVRRGSKQFRPGAKVYIIPHFGGFITQKKVEVIGKPRHRFGLIQILIYSKLIKNVRVQKVYDPQVLERIKESQFYSFPEYQDAAGLEAYAEKHLADHAELADDVG